VVIGTQIYTKIIAPGKSRENATFDEVLNLSVGLLLDEVVDEGTRCLAVGKVGGDRLGVVVGQSRLQEGV